MAQADSLKATDTLSSWCLAKYEGEWNRYTNILSTSIYILNPFFFHIRGFIEEKVEENKFRVLFIDYGTTEIINKKDIKCLNNDDLWLAPPLAVPFVVKSKLKNNSFFKFNFKGHIL